MWLRKVSQAFCLPDNDALAFTVDHHVSVHIVCQRIDMRRVFILSLNKEKMRVVKNIINNKLSTYTPTG